MKGMMFDNVGIRCQAPVPFVKINFSQRGMENEPPFRSAPGESRGWRLEAPGISMAAMGMNGTSARNCPVGGDSQGKLCHDRIPARSLRGLSDGEKTLQ